MATGPGLVVGRFVFPLPRITNLLGRTDRAAGIHPDVDLASLGLGRAVSRRHAQISHRAGAFLIRDVGSRLGTYVNGEPLEPGAERELVEGDAVTIGTVTLTFDLSAPWPEGLEPEWASGGLELGLADATLLPGSLPLIGQLPGGLRRGELRLYYQSQVTLATGEVPSVEALIRWEHPREGLLLPEGFIPSAEDTGLIRSVTSFVLREAAAAAAAWRAAGAGVGVSINVSVRDLEDPSFAEREAGAVEDAGLGPDGLIVEVTESGVMSRPEAALRTLAALRDRGVRVCIDDFGTGQSSLSYVRSLPVDEIKLDGSFSMSMTSRDRAVVRSAIGLAHDLGLTVCAEGVESEEAADSLREMGCDRGQGFYFGRPAPREEFDGLARLH